MSRESWMHRKRLPIFFSEGGSKRFVAAGPPPLGLRFERRNVEVAAQCAGPLGMFVASAPWLELVEKPQTLLRKR